MDGRVAHSLADARRRDPRMRSEAFDAQGFAPMRSLPISPTYHVLSDIVRTRGFLSWRPMM
jgi:hypothetical protein